MPETSAWPVGGGEMGARIRAHDWSRTPLGPVDAWPARLCALVELVLRSPQPACIGWGPDRIVLYNDGFVPLVERAHPAMLGRPFEEAGPDAGVVHRDGLNATRRGEAHSCVDLPVVAGTPLARSTQWFTCSWTPLHDDAGLVVGFHCVATETTESVLDRAALERANAALRESERTYRDLIDCIPAALYACRDDATIAYYNPQAVVLWGAAPSRDDRAWALRGAWGARRPDGARLEPDESPMAEVLATGKPVVDRELRIERPDGTAIDVLVNVTPLHDGDGRVTGAVNVFQDITARKRGEAALHEARRQLEDALGTARMAYWRWDPTTGHMVASASMDGLFGLRPGERFVSSAQGFAIVHPDDRERHRALVERAGARGEGWHTEFRIVRPRDGAVAWLEEIASVSLDPATGAPRTTGLVWDVTARKHGEAAMALERAARERDELRRLLAQAEEAERRRLARELHDQLGQHLTALALGLAGARRQLEVGEDASGRLMQLEELTRLMTRDARHLALELRPPELDDVGLESALQTYAEQWSARFGIAAEVAVTGAAAARPIPAEVGTALYRVVQEALTNVAKHSDARQVTVLVDKPEGEVRLIVEDDGRGFAPEAEAGRIRRERRLGLGSMQERAALVGGT
ncbi:MAG TPA: PAS domain S-box protein, partial [Gemmatimonadaceae bacterium]|nr:PAS domain S-box protein [Gemmatimonadaceae bacterium]